MGEPANLPNFKKLALAVAQGTGEEPEEHETEDRFLGRLEQKGVNVHERVKEELSKNNPKPTDLHRELLRLYSVPRQIRVVTTNFDLLFEQAAQGIFDPNPEVFRAPALPLGHDFNGIVHVHGAVTHPADMVLTDADFGRAYLTEGWARRFLLDLFRSFTVLFVGYSHNDTILNYLARALPASETGGRFALTDDVYANRWQSLGIDPIAYQKPPAYDHSALYKGVQGLADYSVRGILDWQREITEIAKKRPPLNEEEIDLIEEDALADEVKTRFFTHAASSPEWIDWLDERKHLHSLFGVEQLSGPDKLLAQWLAKKFTRENTDALFLLISRHGMRMHPGFWSQLGWTIGGQNDPPLNTKTLSRWISFLLATAPSHPKDSILLLLGRRCIDAGLMDSLIEIFDALAASRLVVKKAFNLREDDTNEPQSRIDVELPLIGEHHNIKDLWQEGLKPNLGLVAEPLLACIIEKFEARYRTLRAFGKASHSDDQTSWHRRAIEPHEQDRYPEAVDVLIDAARDSLEWLTLHRQEVAARWCVQLADSDVPLLRRLAVHTLSSRKDLNPNQKINWFFDHMKLHDIAAHHEVFLLMKKTYPEADPKRRKAIIEAVRAFSWPKLEDENKEKRTASYHFRWFHWLHSVDSNCTFAKEALDDVLERYPKSQPIEHPDLRHWNTGPIWVGQQSPWSVEELLSRPAEEWADKLLSFEPKPTDFSGPDREGLGLAVENAANQKFEWGITLAKVLSELGKWDSDLWPALIRAWSKELTEAKHREVLRRLSRTELYQEHAHWIADALYALVRNEGMPYALNLLQEANGIAMRLWENIDSNEQPSENIPDWFDYAINHTGGKIADFWLGSLSLWRKQQNPKPDALCNEYFDALSSIAQDESLAGRLGRSVLAGELSFLLEADEKWTKENLLPLFKQHEKKEDYQAVWDGFQYVPLIPLVAELMEDALLEAVSHIQSDLFDGYRRSNFIQAYTTMLVYYVDNPIENWIPRFFDNATEEDRNHFAYVIGLQHLNDLDVSRQREWWERWLKRYWQNRLEGVPKQLTSGEVEQMLDWLQYFKGDVFPEAVDVAIRMKSVPIQGGFSFYKFNQSDLWQRYPEAIAKLLVYLGDGDRELIEKLLASDIPEYLKIKLKELRVTLGLE